MSTATAAATPSPGSDDGDEQVTPTPTTPSPSSEVLGESEEAQRTPEPSPTATADDAPQRVSDDPEDPDRDELAAGPRGNVTISEGGATGARVAAFLVAGTVPWLLMGLARWRRTHD